MTTVYFDCFSGASGDMILGALIDAGVPFEGIRTALGSLAIDADAVWTERVVRAGVAATKFQVRGEQTADAATHAHDDLAEHSHAGPARHAHGHPHVHPQSPGAPPHRTLDEIGRLIDGSALSAAGKARAQALFGRMAETEAAIHGTTRDRVHLHEVGALDSIIDIVGTVHAMEQIGPAHVVASPLNVGGGMVRSAHGLYPVPAPATTRLLAGAPIYAGEPRAELVTPTGALLITSYATAFGAVPAMRLERIGYGAGARDFAGTPNVLRVLVGEGVGEAVGEREDVGARVGERVGPRVADRGTGGAGASAGTVVVIEAEIDDMNPQIFGMLMDRLLADGALDVYYTAIQMKKNRPGTLMTILADPAARERLTTTVFRETTTIGVRYREMARECLDRETLGVETPFGVVRVKVARRRGEMLNASPEFDDCARLAREHDAAVKDVQAAAIKAFLDRRPPAAGGDQ